MALAMESTTSKTQKTAIAGLIFAIIGSIIAILLVCKHVFPDLCSVSLGCSLADGVDGCARLGQDPRSKLFGIIPLAVPGLFFYVLMAFLFNKLRRSTDQMITTGLSQLILMLSAFAVVMDAILAYVNFYVLPFPCMLCAYTYIATLGMAIPAFFIYNFSGKGEGEAANMKSLGKAVRSSIVDAGMAFVITVLIIGGFFVANLAAGPQLPQQAGISLLSPDEAGQLLSDFRSLNRVELDEKGLDNVEGSDSAYITIHKFADFRCPHCYHAGEILKQAMERWPGRIRIFYRHFPLDGTCNPLVSRKQPGAFSCNGAQAALCAPEQGIFPAMYHDIFDFQKTGTMITPDALKSLTERLGGNWTKMVGCMSSKGTNRDLLRDVKDAELIKVQATPTLVINGYLMPSGTPDPGFFFRLLDAFVYESEGEAGYNEFRNRIR